MAGAGPVSASEVEPPSRALLRLAGVLTQLAGACCLLLGTIAFVLVQQNKAGGGALVIGWLVGAMAGLVVGGLVYRGGLVTMLVGAAIDAGFGVVLLALEYGQLRRLLRILPASDVDAIGQGLNGAGIGMLVAAGVCLVAIPQGIKYARWLREATLPQSPVSTARGFPPPAPARGSTVIVIPDVEPRSRRRLYIALGGVAIGVGAGIGVMVSSTAHPQRAEVPIAQAPTVDAGVAQRSGADGAVAIAPPGADAAVAVAPPVLDGGAVAAVSGDAAVAAPDRIETPQRLVLAERAAIAKNDPKALAALMVPTAFAIGADAGELADGRDAIEAMLRHDLGDAPAYTVDSKFLAIGEERTHAWIAEDIEVAAPGRPLRRFTISQLAAQLDGRWVVIALCIATPLIDATAERMAILGTLPPPAAIANHHEGPTDLDAAVHASFVSRAAFAAAIASRPDGFNFGSAPGEHIRGGETVKRIFSRMHAEIRLHDGARVAGGGAWDPSQKADPWIAWAAVNVDFTTKTRAATDVTQTFRVLAVFVKEGSDWKLAQSHFSNAGPIR